MSDDDAEKRKKMRARMERDVYSVLVSFKDGATPRQLDNRMDLTLGYTYSGRYHLGGVHDLAELLREHPDVKQLSDGNFKIKPIEAVMDLVALIEKQKDGKGKGKKKGGAQRGRRPTTSSGFHRNNYTMGTRTSPKGFGGVRPQTSLSRPNFQKQYPLQNYSRPSTYASQPSYNFNSTYSQASSSRTTERSVGFQESSVSGQRPLRPHSVCQTTASSNSLPKTIPTQPKIPESSSSNANSQPESPQQTTKICQMPSIKDFAQNAKRMMLAIYPKSVHLSEMTDLYTNEYDVAVDPLRVYSKSWKMLVQSTFADWLEINDGEVRIKEDWAKRNKSLFTAVKPEETLPSIQGFRYKASPSNKSPTDCIVQRMKSLTVGARQVLPTPEKPPGLKPRSQIEPQKEISESRQNTSSNDGQGYDANYMRSLQYVTKPSHMQNSISDALRSNIPRPASVQQSFSKQNHVVSFLSQANAALLNTPSSTTSSSGANSSQPSTLSPPNQQPTRMRSEQNLTPSLRLIGRALDAVRKQDDTTNIRRLESLNSTRETGNFKEQNYKSEIDSRDDPIKSRYAVLNPIESQSLIDYLQTASESVPGRRPLLPPMSKGANLQSRKQESSHPSENSSRSSSVARTSKLLNEAMQTDLPSDQELW